MKKVYECIGLLSSMVSCGDEHSARSRQVIAEAKAEYESLETQLTDAKVEVEKLKNFVADFEDFSRTEGVTDTRKVCDYGLKAYDLRLKLNIHKSPTEQENVRLRAERDSINFKWWEALALNDAVEPTPEAVKEYLLHEQELYVQETKQRLLQACLAELDRLKTADSLEICENCVGLGRKTIERIFAQAGSDSEDKAVKVLRELLRWGEDNLGLSVAENSIIKEIFARHGVSLGEKENQGEKGE